MYTKSPYARKIYGKNLFGVSSMMIVSETSLITFKVVIFPSSSVDRILKVAIESPDPLPDF